MKYCSLALLYLIVLSPLTARAQWFSDSTTNTPVCVATDRQDSPKACSDGKNGAVIAWEDHRSGSSYAVYAQRLDSNGREMWAHNGVAIISGSYTSSGETAIAMDGNGGAYVVWNGYAQHVQSDGTIAYAAAGIKVNDYGNLVLCDDGRGGAFGSSGSSDIYMFQLGPSGLKTSRQIDGSKSLQRHPSICNDGFGGCFIAWETGASIPYSIYAQHLDANATALWNSPGILIYITPGSGNTNANSGHVSIGRDGKQLMLAWEVTGIHGDTQNIMATRVRCSSPHDSTLIWGHGVPVTDEMPGNQVLPQIFSDDSTVGLGADYRGVLVPYLYQKGGSADDWDVCMIRVLGDGNTIRPGNQGFYDFANQPYGQVGFQIVKIPQDTSLLAVWNDARYTGIGVDTCIFAQSIDKYGYERFPTYKSKDKRGKPICHGTWTAKHVTIAPRDGGAIVAWTDFRAGSNDPNIYAQLIFRDGSLPIVLSSFDAKCRYRSQVDLRWTTASEQENAGFEIQRRIADEMLSSLPSTSRGGAGGGQFETIGSFTSDNSLRGAGSSNSELNYSWTDRNVEPAIYEYRLVEVALDGTRLEHDARRVDARFGETVGAWSIGPNVPNPFLDQTVIPLTLPSSAIVDLAIFDVTGREVATPIAHQLFASGMHEIPIDGKQLGIESGSYFVRVVAYDPVSGEISWTSSAPVRISFVK